MIIHIGTSIWNERGYISAVTTHIKSTIKIMNNFMPSNPTT